MSGSRIGGSQSGIVKAELPFCPYCDHRLRKREYPRLYRRALFLAPEYRWQCEACGYAERSRSRLPFNLAISGAFLVLASLSLYIGEEELVEYRALAHQVGTWALYSGLSFLAFGFLVFVVRLFFAEPVFKRLCQQCEAAYVRNRAWTNLDYCSVECVALGASAAEEVSADEIEEVDDDDDEIEDVDDALVEDDPEASEVAAAAQDPAEPAAAEASPAAEDEAAGDPEELDDAASEDSADAPIPEESAADDEQVAEMVLFDEEDAGSGAWSTSDILGEVDEDEEKALDAALGDLENSDTLAASETAEAELSLFDTRRFHPMRDMSGEWDVDEILKETEDLGESEDLTKSVRLRASDAAAPDIEEAVPAEDSESE